jgi:P-type Cu+ transporter
MNKYIKLTFPIEGMTCANCAARIQKTLDKTDGIIQSHVDLASEIALIEIDNTVIEPERIKEKIEKLGYKIIHREEDVSEKEFDAIQKKELYKQKFKFWFSLSLSIPIMILGMNWFYEPSGINGIITLNLVLAFLTSIVLFYSGSQFIKGFYKSIINFYPDMNTLVAIGTLSAYSYSLVELIGYILQPHHHAPHLYFDTTATIITFILLGKYLEKKSKNSSADAVKSLLKMQTHEVTIIRNGIEMITSSEFIKIGDTIILHPGESVPVDGTVIEGSASINESFITGEAIPVDKKAGDQITSGTECKSGALKFIAEKIGRDTYLSSIIELIQKAQSSKPPIQKYVDKIAAIFVPSILSIALVTFLYWNFFAEPHDVSIALVRFVAVLIVSCPCSLGLATPTAIISAIGIAAKHNIYFKDVESIEKVRKIDNILFDKTGTVTTGVLKVKQIITFDKIDETNLSQIAASGEYYSEHPIGKAIVASSKSNGAPLLNVSNFKSLTGYGISFTIDNRDFIIGNKELIQSLPNENLSEIIKKINADGDIQVFIMSDSKILGVILLSDSLKDDSAAAVKKIIDLGIEVNIVSGDSLARTKQIADKLMIKNYFADVKPEGKLNIISALQEKGRIVAMVGDGINDAPALMKADVSMAYLSGTDAAINSSHITLTKNDLNSVFNSIIISNKTMKIIKQNLFWAFFYNLICIPIAAGVFIPLGFSMNPSLAALAMAFSSVSVVSNSLRIKRLVLYDTK